MCTTYNFADAERRAWFWPLGHEEEALTVWFPVWGFFWMVVKEESQIRPVGPYDFSTLLVDPPRFSAFRRADSFEKDLGNAN